MKLVLLLKLQIIYMMMGIAYNVVSIAMVYSVGKPLSVTSPAIGIFTMLVYGLFLVPGFLHYFGLYRLLMCVAVIVFGYGGIILHILNYSNLHLYYSLTAWLLAIVINLFGVSLSFISLSGKFRI